MPQGPRLPKSSGGLRSVPLSTLGERIMTLLADGKPWRATNLSNADAFQYRTIRFAVERIAYQAPGVTADQEIDILLYGDGSASGAAVDPDLNLRWNNIDGDFTVGERMLLLLRQNPVAMQGDQASWPSLPGLLRLVVLEVFNSTMWTLRNMRCSSMSGFLASATAV